MCFFRSQLGTPPGSKAQSLCSPCTDESHYQYYILFLFFCGCVPVLLASNKTMRTVWDQETRLYSKKACGKRRLIVEAVAEAAIPPGVVHEPWLLLHTHTRDCLSFSQAECQQTATSEAAPNPQQTIDGGVLSRKRCGSKNKNHRSSNKRLPGRSAEARGRMLIVSKRTLDVPPYAISPGGTTIPIKDC